ncbi:MAG: MFS transporter, partial [Rhodospirillaceae bacterium]|nr:MFS transporter [Rhodospirillaceae bacterium]
MNAPRPQPIPWLGVAAWLVSALGFFFAWMLRVSPSVMIEPIMAEFKVGGAVLGTLSGLYFYTYALLQTPAGLAIDKWGARRALSLAALVTAAGCALFAAAPDIAVAYIGRLLIGGGVAFAFLGSLVLASAWFPPRRFAMFSGLGMGLGLLGGIAGQAPMAIAVEQGGWRNAMLGLGIAALVLAVATWLIVRDGPMARPPRAVSGAGPVLRGLWQVVR